MRWDNLRLDDGAEPGPAAPLIERRAVARTFDTPGFRGMTFYEVQARSIINRVPAASRMPFHWTINPYRGCSHACVYCCSGDTPILMADGRTKPLRQVRVGDRVYGTRRVGSHRRYVVTQVLDHWQTVKPAHRVTLRDGTRLVASGDHRFLTGRGWRHVTGGESGGESGGRRRPHLVPGDVLVGTGRFAAPPKVDDDYRRGYLYAVLHGHGLTGPRGVRLPSGDAEVLARVRRYLEHFGVPCERVPRGPAERGGEQVGGEGVGVGGAVAVAAVQRLARCPRRPSRAWRTGLLAGLFDTGADGGHAVSRIAVADAQLSGRLQDALAELGFAFTVDAGAGAAPCGVRLTGGVRERLRFLHAVGPAAARRWPLEGAAVAGDASLEVVSVEPLSLQAPLYDITTGTGDFIADGVVSHNCFARRSHEFLDLDAGADFDFKVVVKVNAGELVRRELASPRWRGEHIALGANVDCYQRAEGRYRLMPPILEALRDAANPFSILTKGSLILRDVPLLVEAARRTEVGTAVSVGSVDRELWRLVEPGTPAPDKRLEVCAALNDAGVRCGVVMGPVLPYLSDSPAQLEETVRRIAEAGATSVTAITLHLRPGAREWYLAWLREHRPDLVVPYARLYRGGAYAPREFQQRIAQRVRELAVKYGIDRRSSGHRGQAPPGPRTAGAPPPGGPQQLSLL
ncbi:radical SAM protein [Actinomadura sp. NBRC 104425]|uniref:intein-containing Rv2578c family radical SAM protein n=1 Tax=Actinomadura sp. NBRC 104425 TaxID=3032204 RepID=UPI0024A43DDA|nr:intein-containing Rv2578c family radical SAM protein [Actinomadura sp. NBRC 104425]GLZ11842.1 radical SAM protein [Actinomadura sp. NBRC 104425]